MGNGVMTIKGIVSCSVGSASQSPTYDSDGNMLTYNNWNFSWNAENRLIVASNSTTVVTYAYDYQGRMFEKVTDGTQIAFIWDGNRIVREMKTSPTLSVTHSYIWGAEGTPLAMTDSTNTFFYCLDANKNVTELVDSNGSSVAHYEYSPFGVTTLSTGSLAQTNPFRFSSEYTDSTTDFIHYKYRVYVPQLGRWLSCDPIGERGGWNLYGFIDNDGINYFDNLGLKPRIETVKKCEIVIFVGHGPSSSDPKVVKRFSEKSGDATYTNSSGKVKRNPGVLPSEVHTTGKCFATTLIGCHPSALKIVGNEIKGYKRRCDLLPLFSIGKEIEKALKEARKTAEEICKSKTKCCKEVYIKVNMPDAFAKDLKRKANGALNASKGLYCVGLGYWSLRKSQGFSLGVRYSNYFEKIDCKGSSEQ